MRSILLGAGIVLLAILALALYYDFTTMWTFLPKGSHIWRQADCFAMTLNYKQFHLPFFHPATYNLQSINGNVAGEFPLFYFIAAQFKHPAIALRVMHTIALFVGILSIYFIAFYFLRRRLLSVFCALLFFTSPLLIFYGNNFLSDVPALCFAFLGWAIFLFHQEKMSYIVLSFMLFAIASLLKASEIFHFSMVFFFLIINKKRNIKNYIPFVLCLLPIAWYIYAKRYNQQQHDTYYFLSVFPIWKLSIAEISLAIRRMCITWSKNYFWIPTLILLLFGAFKVFQHRHKLNADLKQILVISFVFVLVYILLFFEKMIEHEYYYTFFFVFFLFLTIAILKTYNCFQAENIFAHTLLFLFLISNIIFCNHFVKEKLSYNQYDTTTATDTFQQKLEQLGITEDKVVLSLPDISPNQSLSLMQRKGYTAFNEYATPLKNKKIDFVILIQTKWEQFPLLQPYAKDSIGTYGDITIYRLTN
ncbi:MAG: hypothetical protein KDD21_09360 [Bacteroidetes bacterium]|nr:hypothetical protein [Bacteroidota bacterium]